MRILAWKEEWYCQRRLLNRWGQVQVVIGLSGGECQEPPKLILSRCDDLEMLSDSCRACRTELIFMDNFSGDEVQGIQPRAGFLVKSKFMNTGLRLFLNRLSCLGISKSISTVHVQCPSRTNI
jgi:hypothetical protein